MANVVVTSSGNSIIVDFGVYVGADFIPMSKASYHKTNLAEVKLYSDHVRIEMTGVREDWSICTAGAGTGLIVDTVDGVAPSSLSDLFDKITALR